MFTKLKCIASFALLGSALAGIALGWLSLSFDVHIPGAILGALAGAGVCALGVFDETAQMSHGGEA